MVVLEDLNAAVGYEVIFSSTVVEGHRNTLLGKHCREIRQTVYW